MQMNHQFEAVASEDRRPPVLAIGAALRVDALLGLLPERLGRVLEIGCGQGGAAWRLAARSTHYTAIEPDPRSFAVAAERLSGRATVLNLSDEQLPTGERFDTVCAFEVLEHCEDDHAVLDRWATRLRPGGRIVLSVPAHAGRMGSWDELVGHFRRYDRGVLAGMLHQRGFIGIREQLYGFPAIYPLEAARNLIARRRLARTQVAGSMAARTAGSGRLYQPDGALAGLVFGVAGQGLAQVQRLFPDRGPGMIVTAQLPE